MHFFLMEAQPIHKRDGVTAAIYLIHDEIIPILLELPRVRIEIIPFADDAALLLHAHFLLHIEGYRRRRRIL